MRDLPSSDVDAACIEIFGDLNDLRAAKLKQAVQYYLNGTKDGFLKYRTASGKYYFYTEMLCEYLKLYNQRTKSILLFRNYI